MTDSVTFRFKVDKASRVALIGDFADEPILMACDSDGVWIATIAKPAPDVYCYFFEIDGSIQSADPQNMRLAPEHGLKRSILETSKLITRTPVQYRVDNLADGTQRHYAVISPKHDGNVAIINLVATGNDTYECWQKVANAGGVLDTMLAMGQIEPCILVLSDTEMPGATLTLRSGDYSNWAAARGALAQALASLR